MSIIDDARRRYQARNNEPVDDDEEAPTNAPRRVVKHTRTPAMEHALNDPGLRAWKAEQEAQRRKEAQRRRMSDESLLNDLLKEQ